MNKFVSSNVFLILEMMRRNERRRGNELEAVRVLSSLQYLGTMVAMVDTYCRQAIGFSIASLGSSG